MQLYLKSLGVGGFRSFKAWQAFDFDAAAGLVYVTGTNEVEPELGANGVGKSSLFEALYWVLFGKTSTNLRASDVANWEGGISCRVVLTFDCDEQEHVLQRTWSPNTLTLDGEAVTQEKIEAVLGLRESSFLHAVFHAQFTPQFADLAPAAQLEAFSEVLHLDVWEEASNKAGEEARATKTRIQSNEVQLARIRGEIVSQRDRLDEAEYDDLLWWRQHLRALQSSKEQLASVTDALTAAMAETENEAVVAQALAAAEKENEDAANALAVSKADVVRLVEEYNLLLSRRDACWQKTCPFCQQPIDAKKLKAWYKAEIHDKEVAIDSVRAAQGELSKRRKKASDARYSAYEAQQKMRDAKRRCRDLLRQRDDIERNYRRAFEEQPPEAAAQLSAEVEARTDEQAAVAKRIAADSDYIAHCEFWQKGFREIRLSLVQQALTQFELTTNTAASALGLHDWEISYAVEGETKSGKATKGFSVFVRSPHNDERVPFAAWSGGERQRLRLAVTLGFADLIQDYAGVRSNVEVFDEPTAWLSEEGVEAIVTLLAERAKQHDLVIYLADHRALDSGDVTRIVHVRKTAEGSVLETE